jgi:KDO2-lipid IV(A) lauroyltransferase
MVNWIFRLLAWLPLPVVHNLGAAVGLLVWLCSPATRQQLAANMAQAGVLAFRRAAVIESGKSLLELPRMWLRPHAKTLQDIVQVVGWEYAQQAMDKQRGVIFLNPHLGNFEISGLFLASRLPMTALFRPPRQAWLTRIMTQGRAQSIRMVPTDLSGVRRLLKALRSGEAIGILPDQVPAAGEGLWVPFFGRAAWTMTLASRLAENGATVLLTWAQRLDYGAGYVMHILPLSSPLSGTLHERTTQINQEMERLILTCPAQYLWAYNRYKQPEGVALPEERPC